MGREIFHYIRLLKALSNTNALEVHFLAEQLDVLLLQHEHYWNIHCLFRGYILVKMGWIKNRKEHISK